MENWVIGIFGPDNAQSFRFDCEAFTVKVRCASLGVSRGLEAWHDCLSRIFHLLQLRGSHPGQLLTGGVGALVCLCILQRCSRPASVNFQTTCTRGPAQELTVIPDPRKRHAQIRRKKQEQVLARSWPSSRRLRILALRSLDLVSDFFFENWFFKIQLHFLAFNS